jgi:hypothetical protein
VSDRGDRITNATNSLMKNLITAVGGILSLSGHVQCSNPSVRTPRPLGAASVESTLVSEEKEVWDANRNRDARSPADLANVPIADVMMDSLHVLLLDPGAGVVRTESWAARKRIGARHREGAGADCPPPPAFRPALLLPLATLQPR